MPELPEVETVARQLAPRLVGRRVRALRIVDSRLRSGPTPRVAGREIVDVSRLGKQVLIAFSEAPADARPLWLAVHLRMTGRLIWTEAGRDPEPRRIRARFVLDRGRLLFLDTRRFGTFRWCRAPQEVAPQGLDPLDPAFDAPTLAGLLDGSPQELKPWLLRQDRLVGLGNIYASEILHRARIGPHRAAGSLDRAEVRRLHRATRGILERAIRNCGTTFSDFQDALGVEGGYGNFLAVYEREGQRCRRCRGTIERVVQQQRSTYHCRDCQH